VVATNAGTTFFFTNTSAGSATVTPTIPAAAIAGDVLVMVCAITTSSTSTPVATVPSGWTQASAGLSFGPNPSSFVSAGAVFVKVMATGDANPSVTWSIAGRQSVSVLALRGMDISSGISTTLNASNYVNGGGTSSTSMAYPSITTTNPKTVLIGLVAAATDNIYTAGPTFTSPSSMVELTESQTTSPSNIYMAGTCIDSSTAGSALTGYNPGTATASQAVYAARWVLAFNIAQDTVEDGELGTSGTGLVAQTNNEYDTITANGTGAYVQYDNTRALTGTQSIKAASVATSASVYAAFTGSVTWSVPCSAAACYYFTANPGSANTLLVFRNSTAYNVYFQISTAGVIQMYNSAGTLIHTFTTALPLNTWFRLELKLLAVSATVGQAEGRIFLDPFSATPDETWTSAATINSGTTVPITVRYGATFGSTNFGPWWMDHTALNMSASYPALPAGRSFSNKGTGVTNGSAVVVGDGGPAPISVAASTSDATLQWSSDVAPVGDASSVIKVATGATSGFSYVAWTASDIGFNTPMYGSFCLYLTSYTSTFRIFGFYQASLMASLSLGSTGLMQWFDSAGTGGFGAFTTAVPLNQWVRIETRLITSSATVGRCEARLFLDPFSSTADEVKTTAATMNTIGGGDPTVMRFGHVSNNTANQPPMYFSYLQARTDAYPAVPAQQLNFPTTGSAAISLTGSANVSLSYSESGTGALSLTAAASDALRFPATAAGALSLTAAGSTSGVVSTATTGTASITLLGAATDALRFASTGTGAIALVAAGSDAFLLTTTGQGLLNVTGAANNALRFASGGSGAISLVASGTATLSLGTTTGTASVTITGAGALIQGMIGQLSIVAQATFTPSLVGNSAITLTGNGVVQRLSFPSVGAGSVVLTGAGTSPTLRIPTTGAGALSLTGAVSSPVLRLTTTAQGFLVLTAVSTYTLTYPRTATGAFGLTGLANATTITQVTAGGLLTITGLAVRLVPNTITSGWVYVARAGVGNYVRAETVDIWSSKGYQIDYPDQPGDQLPEFSTGGKWVTRNGIGYNSNPAINDEVWFPMWIPPGKWYFSAVWGFGPNRGFIYYDVSTNGGSTWTNVGSVDGYYNGIATGGGSSTQFTVPGTTVSKTLVRLKTTNKNASSTGYYMVHQGLTFSYIGP
jgi:hypothetical protein